MTSKMSAGTRSFEGKFEEGEQVGECFENNQEEERLDFLKNEPNEF